MIRTAFNLVEIPFTKDIKPNYLYKHVQFKEFCNRLKHLCDTKGIGLFTGEIGCGKSTAVRAVLESLNPQLYKTVYLYRGIEKVGNFYTQIAHGLSIIPKFRKSDVADQVISAIAELYTQEKVQTILIIDEAHLLKPEIFDEIRLLHNSCCDSCDYLTTAMVGQPSLKQTMLFSRYTPLRQRISVSYHINALDKENAYKYFEHQLVMVKASTKVFLDNAVETIISASKGIPRLINTIALKSMYHAVENKKLTIVDQEVVMEILEELGLR